MALTRIATVITGVSGAPYYSNHYFLNDLGAPQDAADAVAAFWGEAASIMVTDARIEVLPNAQVVDEVTGKPTGLVSTTGSIVTGSGGTAALSPALQLLVQWRTGIYQNGREVRGRTFIPALASIIGTEVPNATALTTAQTAADLLNDLVTPEMVVWSRTHGLSHAVESTGVWSQYAVLRSRRD